MRPNTRFVQTTGAHQAWQLVLMKDSGACLNSYGQYRVNLGQVLQRPVRAQQRFELETNRKLLRQGTGAWV